MLEKTGISFCFSCVFISSTTLIHLVIDEVLETSVSNCGAPYYIFNKKTLTCSHYVRHVLSVSSVFIKDKTASSFEQESPEHKAGIRTAGLRRSMRAVSLLILSCLDQCCSSPEVFKLMF